MKKSTLIALVSVVVLVAGLLVALCAWLLGAVGGEKKDTQAALDYARQLYPQYSVSLRQDAVYLSRPTELSYAQACQLGPEIYCDDLAPESYLPLAKAIAADLQQHYPDIQRVELCYMSTDEQAIFTVSSLGRVWTCWQLP